MNNLIHTKYHQLTHVGKSQLRKEFEDSPKMLRFIEILDKSSKKRLGIKEAVDFIYAKEKEDFEILRNRFFKLRKKLLEHLSHPGIGQSAAVSLMPLEIDFYNCRQLVGINKYREAKVELDKLISTCWSSNIFELLPDALHLTIYCNQALNVFKENDRINDELTLSVSLLQTLHKQRQLARMIYQKILERLPVEELKDILKEFRKIADKNKSYPRFTLYYHFIYASQGAGIFTKDPREIQHSFKIIKDLTTKYPEMPVAFYEPYAKEMLQFYISYGEGMNAFQDGDIFLAYNNLMAAWNIMEEVPGLRSKKTESNYANKIAIEVATKRYNDALKTAEELLEFLIEQKQEEKRLKAYAEIVQIYSYAFPNLTAPDADFLDLKLNSYIKTLPKENEYLYQGTLILKAIFLFQNGMYLKALKTVEGNEMRQFLDKLRIGYYYDLIEFAEQNAIGKMNTLHIELSKQLEEETRPETMFPLQRAVNMISYYLSVN